jgi:hypothetical protein
VVNAVALSHGVFRAKLPAGEFGALHCAAVAWTLLVLKEFGGALGDATWCVVVCRVVLVVRSQLVNLLRICTHCHNANHQNHYIYIYIYIYI